MPVLSVERLGCRVMPSTILVTSLLDAGHGTLRAAIEKANRLPTHGAGRMHSDTIKFAPSVRGTILLESALPVLCTNILISGPGPSALSVARSNDSQTPQFRVFTVGQGAVIKITGLTITGGNAQVGGGIDNAGSLSLVNTTITGNSASAPSSASDAARGGGIENSGALSVADSTISHNSAAGPSSDGDGGGIDNSGTLSVSNCTFNGNSASTAVALRSGSGGGIENSGMLSVTNCTFSGNTASGGILSGESGGAIENSGTLSVINSTFSRNSATSAHTPSFGAGGTAAGGGIENSGTLSVTNCTFTGNTANVGGRGGGISNSGALSIATVTNSTFSGNAATDELSSFGGGISNGGTLTITNSTVSDNSSTTEGGGLDNDGTLTLTNCTISGNAATGTGFFGLVGYGGGIDNDFTGTLTVTNCTISGNSASSRMGVGSFGGGIAESGVGSMTYVTLADNSAASGGGVALISRVSTGFPGVLSAVDSIFQNAHGGNVYFTRAGFRSLGHNLFSDDPGVTLRFDSSDLLNTDPLLGPLANNGGPTLTQALLPGSPAINAGTPVVGVATDQRGAPRSLTGTTCIGAFQVQPPLTVLSVQRLGTGHQPTVLVLTFDLPLDATRAQSSANYRLVKAGATRQVIPIRSIQYNPAAHSVTLRLKTRLMQRQTYMLTVIGTSPGGVTTTVGAYLGANGIGAPGSNYVATIT
jgi:hypothetical protein